MHKYIKKNKEFKYVLFLLLFLSDAIKNDSPQKKKKEMKEGKKSTMRVTTFNSHLVHKWTHTNLGCSMAK